MNNMKIMIPNSMQACKRSATVLKEFRRFKSNPQSVYAKGTLIPLQEAKRFITECMLKTGTPKGHADALAEVLIAADYRAEVITAMDLIDWVNIVLRPKLWGKVFSEMYVNDVTTKMCEGSAVPTILKESPATAFIDGNNGLGPVVGNFCMQLAIKKAKENGCGWVVAKGSNHYGIAGWYSLQAVQQKMIGMSFTNTSPFLTPTRAKKASLGTNPISVAAAGRGNDQFVLDMATTAVAVGKIEVQQRKGEPIPHGWAQDADGQITTDASVAMSAASLMPVGGAEINSGYKGFGLALMVELFCGILGGAQYGPNVRKWMTADRPANLGQCFVAINPSCFAPHFEERLSDIISHLRHLDPVDESKPVLVAGDPEKIHMKKVDTFGGVNYHVNQISASKKLAEKLGVPPMEPLA